jgi:glycosyltransferase 2 family protein
MKKYLVVFLKVAISGAIIAYLVWSSTHGAEKESAFAALKNQPKNWFFLTGAWACAATAVLLTFIRWWYLVRAVEIDCRFRDALRIGFWGYLFNFAPLGIVSGDVVKVVMLAYEHRHAKARATASVIVDRMIGLYYLFVVLTVAILATGFRRLPLPHNIDLACQFAVGLTLAATVALALAMIPGVLDGKLVAWLERLPRVGGTCKQLLDALRMYRRRPLVLAISSAMTIVLHCCFAMAFYLIARGLFGEKIPSLSDHFVIVPLSLATQVIPLPLGPTEFVVNRLYAALAELGGYTIAGQGLVVALGYRGVTLLVAALGLPYYLGNRKEIAEAMQSDDADQPAG